MTLLVDIGNSRIKWAWLPPVMSISSPNLTMMSCPIADLRSASQSIEFVSVQSLDLLAALQKANVIWLSNVAGNAIVAELRKCAPHADWQVVTPQAVCLNLHNHYQQPATLGSDRWLSLLAAWQRYGQSALVVSAGTALTIDALYVDPLVQQAHFLGGSIQPGLQLMWQSLHQGTANLPPFSPSMQRSKDHHQDSANFFAQHTQAAIQAGCAQAMLGAVILQYQSLAQQCLEPPLLLLTGGDATWLQHWLHTQTVPKQQANVPKTDADKCILQKTVTFTPLISGIHTNQIRYDENLVCIGLACLAQRGVE